MRLRIGCRFEYDTPWPTPAVMIVQPHPEGQYHPIREHWESEPTLAVTEYRDSFGNRCQRLVLPVGTAILQYDAAVDVSEAPDATDPGARQLMIEELPDDVLVYTLASRYCLSDALSNVAWHLFGESDPGWPRVQAVCDWIHANIRYGQKSTPLTTAADVYVAGGGICRDFAHLGITFCRALNIPARYVFGYIPDINLPPPRPPMDFHAWFEVYLGDRWWTFDARFNTPQIGRVPIGRGRDAVDVAMMTTYGSARFQRLQVWARVDDNEDAPAVAVMGGANAESMTTLENSDALVLSHPER